MDGWIKLHRQLIESEIFASSKGLKIWIWLLLKVQFEKKFIPIKIGAGESVVTLNRGQLLFGRHKAEEELGIDGSTVYKWLQKLEILGMIKLQSNNHYTIITIDNFNKYNEKSNSRVTTEGTPEEHHVTTEGTPRNTYKNNKNDKNVEEQEKENAPDLSILISLKEMAVELEKNYSLSVSAARRHKTTPDKINAMIPDFISTCEIKGKLNDTIKEYRNYFSNWLENKFAKQIPTGKMKSGMVR